MGKKHENSGSSRDRKIFFSPMVKKNDYEPQLTSCYKRPIRSSPGLERSACEAGPSLVCRADVRRDVTGQLCYHTPKPVPDVKT